jgi:hypothetical protein
MVFGYLKTFFEWMIIDSGPMDTCESVYESNSERKVSVARLGQDTRKIGSHENRSIEVCSEKRYQTNIGAGL